MPPPAACPGARTRHAPGRRPTCAGWSVGEAPAPALARFGPFEILLHHVEPVVAPEHLALHEEGGRAENPARPCLVGVPLQFVLDRLLLRGLAEFLAVEPGPIEQPRRDRLVAQVQVLRPGAMEERMHGPRAR